MSKGKITQKCNVKEMGIKNREKGKIISMFVLQLVYLCENG